MSRLIDKEPNMREKPMRVLVVGLCRTGTLSMLHALRQLGYTPHHMVEVLKNPKRNIPLWTEAMNANFRSVGKPYGREEFDRLLGHYDAGLDVPLCLFFEDLYKAYPDAKFILTNRDVDKWMTSMHATVFNDQVWRLPRLLAYIDSEVYGPLMTCVHLIFEIFCGNDYGDRCRQAYLDHCERVRQTIPKEQLLEYNLGDGWEPLCKFLDVPVPDNPYPRINDPGMFKGIIRDVTKRVVRNLCQKFIRYSWPIAILGAAVWYQWYGKFWL